MSKRLLTIAALSILLHLSLLLWGPDWLARVDQAAQVLPLSVVINQAEPARAQSADSRAPQTAKKTAEKAKQSNAAAKLAPVPQPVAPKVVAMNQPVAADPAAPNLAGANPAPEPVTKAGATKEIPRSAGDDGGDSVQAASFNAAYLNNPKPEVPYIAQRRCQSGLLKLRVSVNAAGKPVKVSVDKPSGCDAFDRSALETVKKDWRFVPAKRGATAIESEVIVPMPLEIREQ